MATIIESVTTEAPLPAVSWPAIFAGGVAAAAVSLVLLLLGAGLGLTTVSPWSDAATAGAALGVGALIWMVVMQWVSAGMGGYLAGRLRNRWAGVHGDEGFFRDTAHGFLSWGLATILTAALLGSAASAVVGGAAKSVTTVAAGAAQGAVQSAGKEDGPTAYLVDTLFRGDAAPGTGGADALRAETGRILTTAIQDGNLDAADRSYLAQRVAAATGIDRGEAEQRIDAVIARMEAAAAKAREAADKARKAAAAFALVSFLSLLVGAFIASVAAALGGRQRDEDENAYRPA